MKVLWVLGSFFPANTGGVDTVMYWIAKTLSKQKVDLSIATGTATLQKKVVLNKWQQTHFGKVIYVPTWIHYLPFRLIIKAFKEFRKHKNIHLCNIFYPSSIALASLAAIYHKNVLLSIHGELDPWARNHHWYKKKPFIWFVKIFLKNKIYFHATCPEEVQYIKDAIGSNTKILLVPNYILLPERMDVPHEKNFLFVGRIHPKKGVENLISALAISKYFGNSPFRLQIVGDCDNNYGRELQNLVRQLDLSHKVFFLGYKEGKEKHELYAKAHFSFMPSITENFGMVVVESLAQATPVVATTGAPWNCLESNKAGFWEKPNPKNLAKIIDKIITQPTDEYLAYRQNAYDLVCQKFDLENNINQWVDTYEKVFCKN